jgi:hypothetical protein
MLFADFRGTSTLRLAKRNLQPTLKQHDMNKDFWKRPSFIASVVTLFCWLLLSYLQMRVGGYGGGGASGLDIATAKGTGFGSPIGGIDYLLWLIPALNVFLIWASFNPNNPIAKPGNLGIARIAFLVVAAFFWVRYMFLIDGGGIVKVSAGIGLWITLLAAVFLQFEGPIMKKVNEMANKQGGGGTSTPPPPPPSGNPA